MANKEKEQEKIFNEEKFNKIEAYATMFCKDVNNIVSEMKEGDYLHVSLTGDFIRKTVNTFGSNIMEGFDEFLNSMIEETHVFMRDKAVEFANGRKRELAKIVDRLLIALKSETESTITCDIADIIFDCARFNKQTDKFEPDANIIREYCTTTIEGDKLAFVQKLRKVVDDLNALRNDCVSLYGANVLFCDMRNSGFIDTINFEDYKVDLTILEA